MKITIKGKAYLPIEVEEIDEDDIKYIYRLYIISSGTILLEEVGELFSCAFVKQKRNTIRDFKDAYFSMSTMHISRYKDLKKTLLELEDTLKNKLSEL